MKKQSYLKLIKQAEECCIYYKEMREFIDALNVVTSVDEDLSDKAHNEIFWAGYNACARYKKAEEDFKKKHKDI